MTIGAVAPVSGTFTGTTASGGTRSGTFEQTVSSANGVRTVDTVATFANGKQADRVVTYGPNGNISVSRTFNGRTTTRQETATTNADGSVSLVGTITKPGGATESFTATRTATAAGGTDTQTTITNAAGATETLDTTRNSSNGSLTLATTGTGFGGKAFSSAWTGTITA